MSALKVIAFAGITVMGTLLFSCQHEPELVSGTPEVCFRSDVLPTLQKNCAVPGCHDGTKRLIALNSYENVMSAVSPGKPMASKLHKAIIGNPNFGNFMPPSPRAGLTKTQIDFISLWILQGAKDIDTTNVSFSKTIQPIFDQHCATCHNTTTSGGGFMFIDYASDTAAIHSGRFLGAIDHTPGFSPMPKGTDSLCVCYTSEIKNWIHLGMPKN